MHFSVYLICSYFFHNFTAFQVNRKSRPRPPGQKDQHGNYIILSVLFFFNQLSVNMSICVPARKLSEHKSEWDQIWHSRKCQKKKKWVCKSGSVQPGTTEKNTPANPSSIQPYVKGSWALNWNTAKCSILSSPPPGICILLCFFCAYICVSTQTTKEKAETCTHSQEATQFIITLWKKRKCLLWLFIAGKGIPCIMIYMLSLSCCR